MQSSEFFQPAEWASHESVFLAWPSHADLWRENLPAAQTEFTKLCQAIADVDPTTGKARGELLEILVFDDDSKADAQKALSGLPVRFHPIPYGDIWLRDTAPIFLMNAKGDLACAKFVFNGWGGKYELPFDPEVSTAIAHVADVPVHSYSWILEGGSVEVDGEGTCLTSKQCLLNPNRNPSMDQAEIEKALGQALGVKKVLWLDDGLLNDHTDGHIDTIARYVGPATIACMVPNDPTGANDSDAANESQDPNAKIMEQIARDLESFTDAKGRNIKVARIPSPGKILSSDGEIMPASYLNFYIANSTVIVPTYGSANDEKAVSAIAKLFPTRRTIGSSAFAILSGGGAFHCITQQRPTGGMKS
jgi:agmatine deiminase